MDNLELDEVNCPQCEDFTLVPKLLQKNENDMWPADLQEGCSTVNIGNFVIVTGGY